jgi:CubicO group peptidase (beta-lactamase class C family)
MPGRDDVLVAVGEHVDGSPADAAAPFFASGLTESLMRTVAFQLIDEGVLDPSLPVDQWLPTMSNADRVTVQMVLDRRTGWADSGPIEPDPVLADLARVWALREAVESRATVMTAVAEPGTPADDSLINASLLGLVVEEVAGRPLAELIRDRVSGPAGLDDTVLADRGLHRPDTGMACAPSAGRRWIRRRSTPRPTSPGTRPRPRRCRRPPMCSISSTPGRQANCSRLIGSPVPDRYEPEPADNPSLDFHNGVGVPFNGVCPCRNVDGGIEPTAFGRMPSAPGSRLILLRYTDDISVVVNVNSNEAAPADIQAVANEVHDIAREGR